MKRKSIRHRQTIDQAVKKFQLKELRKEKKTLLKEKKYRDTTHQLKHDIRNMKTERYAGPLVGGAKKTISFLRGGQQTVAKGARRTMPKHKQSSSRSLGWGSKGSGLGLADLNSSNAGSELSKGTVEKKKEHYLEW